MVFVDWLNMSQQFPPSDYPDFLGGRVVSVEGACGLDRRGVVDPDTGEIGEAWSLTGSDEMEIEFSTPKFARHRGSYETTIMVRMVGGKLEVRGNPSAYGRLDNLFGLQLDDCVEVYNSILADLGLPEFTEGEEVSRFFEGSGTTLLEYTGAKITRVDYTCNQAVGMGRVRDYNKWLAGQKFSRSGPGDDDLEKFARWGFGTVYTSNSKFWINAKHYDKADALENVTLPNYLKKLKASARGDNRLKGEVYAQYKFAEDYLSKLAEWCAELGVVRSEYSFRSRWFSQHEGLGFWKPNLTDTSLYEFVEIEMNKIASRAVVYQEEDYDSLTPAEFKALTLWKKGSPLHVSAGGNVANSTFYRLRSGIMKKTGHDIAARPVQTDQQTQFRPVYFQVRPLTLRHVPAWYQRASVPLRMAA
jgi:hypothetical protein